MMGNHEYCEDCGANSHHYGKPCNPEMLAAMQKSNAQAARLKQKEQDDIRKRCKRSGLSVEFTQYGPIVSKRTSRRNKWPT